MCGFVGVWHRDGTALDVELLASATSAIRHRGPDDEGGKYGARLLAGQYAQRRARELQGYRRSGALVSCTGPDTSAGVDAAPLSRFQGQNFDLGLGFRRLSILDLSAAGHQPMATPDGQTWIVFNGEVYNYIELRRELQGHEFAFQTGTDTEVVLAAYRKWGPECLTRLNGMWAFAIWDNRSRSLFLARDRFGIKPLFFAHTEPNRLLFGSEIKALHSATALPFRPCASAVAGYIALGQLPSPTKGSTFYKGIQSLPAAQWLTVTNDSEIMKQYWSLPAAEDSRADVDALCGEYLDLFQDSVRIQLRSDVPIGTCLSGGLDSSSIVAVINQFLTSGRNGEYKQVGKRQNTFSAVYDSSGPWNERTFIDHVVRATNVEPHFVRPTAAGLWEDAQRLVAHQDEPFVTLSIFAQWNVMRLVSQANVKVLLDGQGADELLGGYRPFSIYLREIIGRGRYLKAFREAGLIGSVNSMNSTGLIVGSVGRFHLPQVMTAWQRAAATVGRQPRRLTPWRQRGAISASGLHSEHRAGLDALLDDNAAHKQSTLTEHLSQALTEYSLPHLLRYEDRNSMAFSIEARVPFLDHRLVEFVFRHAGPLRIRQGWTKWIHRKALDPLLPKQVCWRRDKVGFEIPEGKWLRESQGFLEDLFTPGSPAADYLDLARVRADLSALPGIADGRSPTTSRVWRWTNLALWLKSARPVANDRNSPTSR